MGYFGEEYRYIG